MTDDSTDDFEARVRRDLGAIAENVPAGTFGREGDVPDGSGASAPHSAGAHLTEPASFVPRRRTGAVLVAAALALLAGVGIYVLVADDDPSETETAITTTSTVDVTPTTPPPEMPPPSESGDHRIWLSSAVVSSDGADLVFAVVGPPGDPGEVVYGLETRLDRWTGSEWELVTAFSSCADFWSCWGRLPAPEEMVDTPGIGLSVGAEGVGPAEYVRIDDLAPGWYRFRRDVAGSPATGNFEIVEPADAPVPAPTPDLDAARFAVRPVVIGDQGATVRAGGDLADGYADLRTFDTATLEVWSSAGAAWSPYLEIDVGFFGGTAETVDLRLPALPPGAYRLVAEGEGESAVGRFWVDEEVPSTLDCTVLPTLAELLGDDAAPFDGPHPPTVDMRPSFTAGGFRMQWSSPRTTITYSYPTGGVRDLVGERTVQDGPVMLWYQRGPGTSSTVEAWVQLPECTEGFSGASFSVSGGPEEANAALALRLGRELAERYNPDFAVEPRDSCPDESSPPPDTPYAVLDVWMLCRTDFDSPAELVPVKMIFSSDDPLIEVIRRSLGQPWNGLETAVPIELWAAPKDITIEEGVLRVEIDYDFAVAPINNFSTSSWSERYLHQLAANAFQFDEVEAIDLDKLCCGDWSGLYTRADWESELVGGYGDIPSVMPGFDE